MAPRKNESSEGSKKGERSGNFTNAEKNTFVELLPQFEDKIECKRTDAMTRQEKKQAWADLVEAFNFVSSHTPRTEKNLRNLWESMKKAAKKNGKGDYGETVLTAYCKADDNLSYIVTELNASHVACNDGSINEAVNGNTDASGSLSGKDDQVWSLNTLKFEIIQ
ncbi:hypothetical protein QAD02_023312 [Eretmocerus hayati]|uniref:Uncharacterized protein n=1 Tax=Eretmocerus hayati TaxID=131215 RepID=A0ACC2PVJ6_9HYME|nr:hypothetical protein QAD02_023312 [Eretmocerus hayati]